MKITVLVEKGSIKLVPWESGTVVHIEPVEDQLPTLFEILEEFDGMAYDLPTDLAANLDHYVHGHLPGRLRRIAQMKNLDEYLYSGGLI